MGTFTKWLAAPAALALASLAIQDSTNLTRTYKADEVNLYSFKVKANAGGTEIDASADIELKVSKLLENGNAKGVLTLSKLNVIVAGNPTDMAAEPFETEFNPNGLPDRLSVNQIEFAYTILSCAGAVPGKQVKTGDSFEFSWENKDKSSRVKGKGKLVELVDLEDVKSAKVEYTLEVYPDGEQTPGIMKCTSVFAVDGARLLKSEGSVNVEGNVDLTFTITRAK